MNQSMKQIAIKFGTYLALLNIFYMLYAYLVDSSVLVEMWLSLVTFILSVGIGIFAVRKFKQSNKGYASFKEAFSTYMLTAIFSIAVYTFFTMLLFNFDTNFAAETMDLTLDNAFERYQNSGMSNEEIEQNLSLIKNSDPFSILGQLKTAAFSVMFTAIFALIVGVTMKRNNPVQ